MNHKMQSFKKNILFHVSFEIEMYVDTTISLFTNYLIRCGTYITFHKIDAGSGKRVKRFGRLVLIQKNGTIGKGNHTVKSYIHPSTNLVCSMMNVRLEIDYLCIHFVIHKFNLPFVDVSRGVRSQYFW